MKKAYIYANGQILCEYEGETDPNRHFCIHDRLGSVRLVVNDTAAVNNSYAYTPFGSEFPTDCNETVYNPFKFTGQWFDPEIAQYYLRARMYDPILMRFTGRDPVRGKFTRPLTLHVYLYCANDPLNRIDSTGRSFWNVFGALSAGTAVRSLATLVLVKGINLESDFFFNAGLQMHHLIAPAMYLGALAGPLLPAGGQLAIKAAAATWHGLAAGATGIASSSYVIAREISLYAMTNPKALMYATDNVMDAIAALCNAPVPPHTPAGAIALAINAYVEDQSYDY